MFYDESEREVVFDFFAKDAVGTGKGGGALCKEFELESGSRGRIRTDDQRVNSALRYRCATREC